MTIRLADRGVRAILLDIEGTTTPIAFVHEVLFPYAAARLDRFLAEPGHAGVVESVAGALAAEHAADAARDEDVPAWVGATAEAARASVAAYARWLMARDRKSPGLKDLQGRIWEEGYQAGELSGQVFEDVPRAIRRWHERGLTLAIYSSGSELAQRRLFESTPSGNLTPYIDAFFDTRVGAKTDAPSYEAIARRLDRAPHELVFISDVARELLAARDAGLQVLLSRRPGNPPQPDADGFESIDTFENLT